MLFRLDNLTKVYGARTVLDIAQLVLDKGKIYGLLGPNGAGKTTLLEILSFLLVPTTGRIYYQDQEVTYAGDSLNKLRREVVLVPQTPIMFTTSVYKNVEFGLAVRKVPKKERARMVAEALDMVGLRAYAHEKAHKLSGGETQRAAIARALACSPQVIFFDEPTANVDVENQIVIENIIRTANLEKGVSVILTTHNLIQAARLSEATISLFNGKIASSIYENIFSAEVQADESGRVWCQVGDRFRVGVATELRGRVRVSFDPWAIEVSPLGPRRNLDSVIAGRIIQVTHEGNSFRLLVEAGAPLSVLLAADEYLRSPFLPGSEVMLEFPPRGIEII
ncbi:MAG: ATP-binding cassette domain-containing protein [Pseudomonadota bacterium]